jgi:DNA polymerase
MAGGSEISKLAAAARARLEAQRLAGVESVRRGRRPDVPAPAARAATPAASATVRPPPAPPEARRAILAAGAEKVADCRRCRLAEARTRTVYGVGDPAARLCFVGEGPGVDEDRRGEPFVGRAGQLLDRMIAAMGLQRREVYICNTVKCRPPENRTPLPDEMDACWPFLEEQLETVRPEVIVALGRPAAMRLLGTDAPMGRLRGRFHEWKAVPVMPTYHPAYLLRTPTAKRAVWEDLQAVMAKLGLEAPARAEP